MESGHSLLFYKSELPVDGTAGNERRGLGVDVFGRLGGAVGEGAAQHHQAAQAGGLSVPL